MYAMRVLFDSLFRYDFTILCFDGSSQSYYQEVVSVYAFDVESAFNKLLVKTAPYMCDILFIETPEDRRGVSNV